MDRLTALTATLSTRATALLSASPLSSQHPAAAVALAVIILLLILLVLPARKATPSRDRAVIVSGCDTGLGRGLAERLLADGWTVVCGCFTAAGVSSWTAADGALPVRLDICHPASVDAAATIVGAWLRGAPNRSLHALVNNAGVASGGQVDWCPMEEYRRTMDVK